MKSGVLPRLLSFTTQMKECKDCGQQKPLSEFYSCGKGVTPRCRPCHRAEMKNRRSGEAWETYYQKNREKILKACSRYYHRKKHANHSER